MKKPTYKITITKKQGYWKVNIYTLHIKPVYEPFGKVLLRHEEEWQPLNHWREDIALFYWEARIMAWNMKRKLDNGTFFRGEETIYERKG